ncbi:hypothetical protein CVT25_004806 [Psilocybe cyanescens]|uniref:Uncharacterized protein n=1 Tax=Psilocybe cyanescens TaxID=93625 RepID=A0A409XGK7_PSICY|nr:hypothetical protein CVT25_004806 [Psilocybe cyanescens]
MRLASSDQTPEGNIPVALFNYGEASKFVRVWDDYEDTIYNICLAFGISRTPGSISLRTSSLDICKGRDVAIDKSAYPLMWTFLDEMTVSVDPEKSEEAIASLRRAEKAPERITPTPDPGETTIWVPSSSLRDDIVHPKVEEEAPREGKRWEEQIWEEEVNEESPSPVEVITHQGRSAKNPEPETHAPKKFKAAVADGASSTLTTKTAHDDIFPHVKQEKTVHPLNEEAPRRERSPRKDNQTIPAAEDPRFEIGIVGPGNDCVQFKTRGKHQVRKVLAAACKTFDMDESRAQLVLSLSIEDEDGEIQVHNFVCAPEETIQGCGVNAGSKLYLKMLPENVDDNASD